MSVRPYRDIDRRQSRRVNVGAVPVGDGAPISVQSMTNTLTSDAPATIAQIRALEDAGADIVRVSCPDEESTAALRSIVDAVTVPIVADIHFHYKRAIEAAEAGAACLRINPSNIGKPERVSEVVAAAVCEASYTSGARAWHFGAGVVCGLILELAAVGACSLWRPITLARRGARTPADDDSDWSEPSAVVLAARASAGSVY